VWRVRKVLGWIFAVACLFFAFFVWIFHYPPQHGQPFIDGGDASPLLTTIKVCAFYFVVISVPGVASWTIWKERASSRIWGIAASITSLFVYLQPNHWYQIQERGVWVHWAICLLGLIAFLAPQSERREAHTSRDQHDEEVPSGGGCYAFGILFPLVYLLTVRRDRQNPFLRFHCIQCFLLFLVLEPLLIYTTFHPRGPISEMGITLFIVTFFVTLVQAHRRKRFHLPIIGSIAERLS